MQLLVLGGTRFVGRHIVDAALARSHEVTLFNRGKNAPGLWNGVTEIHGDRDGGLDALEGRTWDAVIDVSGYLPRIVRASAEAVADAADHYLFISSISAYADLSGSMVDEEAPLATIADETVEVIDENSYGALKALCERVAQDVFAGRCCIVRPGLVAGPGDHTDRLTYWVVRVAAGGTVLAPGPPQRVAQFIDARDLGRFVVHLIENRSTEILNGVSPPTTISELLEVCRDVSRSDAAFEWVDDEFLVEAGVEPWTGLPLWLPDDLLGSVDATRALRAGLQVTPLRATVEDTLAWWRAEGRSGLATGPSRERERELLEAHRSA